MCTSTASVPKLDLGSLGESCACSYLTKCLGWQVIDRNVRTRYGELDIVALRHDGAYVFVEVRARSSHRFGNPLETVTQQKLARLMQQMDCYFATHHICQEDRQVALDVIGLTFAGDVLQSLEHVSVLS